MAEPNGYIQGKGGQPIELVDATARRKLAGKLDAPGNVKAGDYLRVQSIGADGTVVLEGTEGTGNGSGQNATDEQVAAAVGARLPDIIDGVLEKMPIVGVVDEANVITLYGGLQVGEYTLKYEHDDGGSSEIGSLTITAADIGKELIGIAAVYNGGDVAVGTAFSGIPGIVVTAQYDDGSTSVITDYTITPGTIVEGENTITVTYGGFSASVVVMGVSSEVADSLAPAFTAWEIIPADGIDYTLGANGFDVVWGEAQGQTNGALHLNLTGLEAGRAVVIDFSLTSSTGVTNGIGFNAGTSSGNVQSYGAYINQRTEIQLTSSTLFFQFKVSNSKYTGGYPVTVTVRDFRVYYAADAEV